MNCDSTLRNTTKSNYNLAQSSHAVDLRRKQVNMREVMTPDQVAQYLQLTTDTIYRLIRQEKLAASKIGRVYRIPKEDVDAFLLAHSTRPQVRQALFKRVLSIAERNPGVNSDQVLEELEELDREREQFPARMG